MEATQTRQQELQERIAELKAQEEAQKQELVELAGHVELELKGKQIQDSQKAASYRLNRTRPAVKAKRDTHVERLRAEAELKRLLIQEVDDQLPHHRAKVERLLEQREQLDTEIAAARKPVDDLAGQRRRSEIEYYRLTHEANSFEYGTESM